MKKLGRMALVVGLCAVFVCGGVANADTIKMNDGSEIVGKIVLEGSDFVKIEFQTSATIKESKMLKKSDIKEIVKTAPDDVAWEKIKDLVPTKSLMTASRYRTMIEAGPKPFLATFPNSTHATKVSEILKTLTEELDKVERGHQKIEDKWFSPEDRTNFMMVIAAKKRFLAMKNQAAQGNIGGYVQAMRTFQDLEENYYGSPGHAKALAGAKSILPILGQTSQRFLRDVAARNKQWETNKELLDPGAKSRVMAARKQEEMVHQRNLAADRAAGIKWVRANIRSSTSLTELITLIKAEIERLDTVDAATLKGRAEKLYEADGLIAKGKLIDAKVVLAKIEPLPGDGKLNSKKRRSSSKKKKKKTTSSLKAPEKDAPKPKSYFVAVSNKLNDKLFAVLKAEEDAAASAKAADVVKEMKKNESKVAAAIASDAAAEGTDAETAAAPAKKRKSLLGGLASEDEPEEKKKKDAPKKKEKKPKKKGGTDWSKKAKEREARGPSKGGGEMPSWAIPAIISVVMVVVVVFMKVAGLGGKKD